MKPAIFFDRDGVLNIEKGYVFKISDFEWVLDAPQAIKLFNENNYHTFVVTNQSGIGRGIYSEKDVENLHKYMNDELSKISARIDDFFYSPYHPEGINKNYDHLSHLRKPSTGMLELAFQKWEIIKEESFMIGDNITDIECAEMYGIKGHLFKEKSLLEFVKKVIKL